MPNKETFKIIPIAKLLKKYITENGRGWIDPFAGDNSPAEFTNDLNPNKQAECNLEAVEFCKMIKGPFRGVIFDPPYSNIQITRSYGGVGLKATAQDTGGGFYSRVKNAAAPKIITGGYAISFGWNSAGFGMSRGFKIVEILLVCHGGAHNDTIVTVEIRNQALLEL